MEIQLIRNATMKLSMAGKTILTDPVLLPRHGIDSFAGIEKNPTVDLPLPVADILKNIDMVVVSHLHQDHFDSAAKEHLPKGTPIYCQPDDADKIRAYGFHAVHGVDTAADAGGIAITRTPSAHAGNRKWRDILGNVSGFIFRADSEPSVYWAGDTIFNDDVKKILQSEKPDIILTHSCGAVLDDSGPIVMDAEQTIAVCRAAPWATVVAVHLEALDHGTVSRRDVRELAEKEGIRAAQLLIPDDGERLRFQQIQRKGKKP